MVHSIFRMYIRPKINRFISLSANKSYICRFFPISCTNDLNFLFGRFDKGNSRLVESLVCNQNRAIATVFNLSPSKWARIILQFGPTNLHPCFQVSTNDRINKKPNFARLRAIHKYSAFRAAWHCAL